MVKSYPVFKSNIRCARIDEKEFLITKFYSLEKIENWQYYKANREIFAILEKCNGLLSVEDIAEQTELSLNDIEKSIQTLKKLKIIEIASSAKPSKTFADCPLSLNWYLTRRCNFFCKHCWIEADKKYSEELDINECREVVDKIANAGVISITFTGGEPSIRDDLNEIVQYACKKKMMVEIDTNGSLGTHVVRKLTQMRNRIKVSVSLDGSQAKIHDSFRNYAGAFDEVVKTISLLREHRIPMRVSTVVNSENVHDLQNIYFLIRKLGVTSWTISHIFYIGRALKNRSSITPTINDLMDALFSLYLKCKGERIKLRFPMNPDSMIKNLNVSRKLCEQDSLRRSLDLLPDGQMFMCSRMPETILGNVLEDPVEKMWKESQRKWIWSATVNDLPHCRKCKFKYICGGGCRAEAKNLTDDYLSNDPVSCEIMNHFYQNILPKLPKIPQKQIDRMVNLAEGNLVSLENSSLV